MRALALFASLAVVAGACQSGDGQPHNGYAVDLAIDPQSDVMLGTLATVHISVTGDETYDTTLPTTASSFVGGEARVIYRPRIAQGHLTFSVEFLDASGAVFAAGMTPEVVLVPGDTVVAHASVASVTPVPPDLSAPADMMPPPDLTASEGAVADMMVPPDLTPPRDGPLDAAPPDMRGVDMAGVDSAPPDLVKAPPPDLVMIANHCSDGIKDADETDVDCGGATCARCADGKLCAADTDCSSGHHCLQGQTAKLCSPLSSCPLCQVVSTSGQCVFALANTNPKGECVANAASCKAAVCDGAGTCNVSAGTACAAPMCVSGTAITATCSTTGTCATQTIACGSYACASGACPTSCTTGAQCATGYACQSSKCITPTLKGPTTLTSKSPFGAMAFADFNRDGHPDAAVLFQGTAALGIAYGKGDGSFTDPAATAVTLRGVPSSVAVADFNHDGWPDIVVGHPNGIDVLFDKAGNFSALQVSTSASSLVGAADFTRDGLVDIVAWDVGIQALVTWANVNHGGSFQEANKLPLGFTPSVLIVADTNQDGWADVVIADGSGNRATSLQSMGTAGFTPPTSSNFVNTGTTPVAGAKGDLNADGTVDFVLANQGSNDLTLVVPVANQSPGLGKVSLEGKPADVAMIDLDLDGKSDLVALIADTHDLVYLHNTTPQGSTNLTFDVPVSIPVGDPHAANLAVADTNSDGRSDVVVSAGTPGGTGALYTFLDTLGLLTKLSFGSQAFVGGASTATTQYILVADARHRGVPDALTLAPSGATVQPFADAYTGQYGPIQSFSTSGGTGFGEALGDLDGDGNLDVVLATGSFQLPVVFQPFGEKPTQQALFVPVQAAIEAVATGDLDGDGRTDLVIADQSGMIYGALNTGNGGLGYNLTFQMPANQVVNTVTTADLDGDGRADVLAWGGSGIDVLLSSMNWSPQFYSTWPSAIAPVVFDVDNDGDLDFVRVPIIGGTSYLVVEINNGSGGFGATGAPSLSVTGEVAGAAGDFNHDGLVDVAITTQQGIVILLNAGGAHFTQQPAVPATNVPAGIAVGDANLDGKLDLLFDASNGIGVVFNQSQ